MTEQLNNSKPWAGGNHYIVPVIQSHEEFEDEIPGETGGPFHQSSLEINEIIMVALSIKGM